MEGVDRHLLCGMIREVGDNKYKFLNLYMKTEASKNPIVS